MSAPGSSGSIPFRSKKRLMDSPCSKSQPGNPSMAVTTLPTPEKPPENMLSRSRNRSVALSTSEVREASGSSSRSEDSEVKVSSAKSQLLFSPSDSSKRVCTTKSSEKENLPEKYEILGQFFTAMDSAIRLLKLKGSKPTFFNISVKIEHLTERRFCYSHLAQLKHILPEAIEIKKVMIYDENSSCMKPNLHVTLNIDAVEYNETSKSASKNIAIRKVFRARLADFVKAHPQGDEVPEEPLPELYNRSKANDILNDEVKSASSVIEEMSYIPADKLISLPVKVASTPVKSISKLANVPSTPVKLDSTEIHVASTPPEFASTPVRLFSSSFTVHRKKRSSDYLTPVNDSTEPPVQLARRSAPRSLNFDTYTEDEKPMDITNSETIDQEPEEDASSDDDLSILPDTLRQSIKEQEKKAIEDQDPAISQAKRRQKMIAHLPKLFNVIHYFIQSVRRWVITKEELVYKIIAGHSDITDRQEVEEQLSLMLELVPDWISEKRASTGDLLVCINKLASPVTIRSRLEQDNKKVTPITIS